MFIGINREGFAGFAISSFIDGLMVTITTKLGKIKRTNLSEFTQTKITTRGLKCMPLSENDEVISCLITRGASNKKHLKPYNQKS